MVAKTKIVGLILATAVALTSPMLVYADNGGANKDSGHQDGGWHHGQGDQMMAKILNLSETQEKQLKDSRQKQKEVMKNVFKQINVNREAFDTEIAKSTPDMNKINDIQAQLKAIQSQMVDNHLNSILEIKKILTPEQFAGYMALERAKKLMMHKGHGQFDHKDKTCKMNDHGADKSYKDHDADEQE